MQQDDARRSGSGSDVPDSASPRDPAAADASAELAEADSGDRADRAGGTGSGLVRSGEIEAARPSGSGQRYAILVVDDEEAILESIDLTLSEDYRVFTASSGEAGLEILEREEIALIIADQVMPGLTGVEFLERSIERRPQAIRILLTGHADMDAVVRAVNEGRIYRYMTKPWEPDALRLDVKRGLEVYELAHERSQLGAALRDAHERLHRENVYLRREVQKRYAFSEILGESPAMQRIFDVLEKVAETDATVLLTGETGTGKDLVARAVHYAGPRKDKRFLAQNCGALPETLLESELFGHKRGAFTGAHVDKKGLFEIADGGTIFLDEIGETTPGMQVRLLRVLQDGEIRPLGTADTRRVDVRIVAATNRDLAREVAENRFREDLYYRLRVVEIGMPPLRERRTDIPLLAHHFLDAANKKMGRGIKGFTNEAMDRLMAHDWTGNVRELGNEIERAVALAGTADTIGLDMFSEHIRGVSGRLDPAFETVLEEHDLNRAVDELKRMMIVRAIEQAGSKSRAAEQLGIPRQSLQKMMKRLGLSEPSEGAG